MAKSTYYDSKTNSDVLVQNCPKTIPFKDHYCRISYLYQIATDLQVNNKSKLSRMCIKNMDSITKKTTSKLKPSIKRTYCKTCYTRLIDGVNTNRKLHNVSKKQEWKDTTLLVVCGNCKTKVKNFPVGKSSEYMTYSEIKDNIVNVE